MKAFSTYFSDSRWTHWCCLVIFALFTVNTALANHDDCSGAIPLICGDIISGNNEGATAEPLPACGMVFPGQTLWYSIVGTGGNITASTCSPNTDFDTQLGIFSGTCGALTCVAGNNNDLGCDNPRYSTVTWASTANVTYYIVVAGVLGADGDFELSIDCEVVAPPNDLCADAEPIGCGETVSGNTETASTEPGLGFCGTSLTSAPGLWYSHVGDGSLVTVSTCNTADFDTKIGVFSGTCGALVCEAGNDDGSGCSGFTSETSFISTPGTTYYIYVTGFGSATGSFDLSVTCDNTPDNDICDDAELVECGGVVTGNTDSATPATVGFCGTSLTSSGGVWYELLGDGSTVTLTTCNPGTDYDTKLGVFSGSCGSLTCVGGNDDQGGGFDPACDVTGIGFNRGSTVTFETEDGVSYFILVTGFSTNTGNFEMTIDCVPPPPPPTTCDEAPSVFCGDVVVGNTRDGSVNNLNCGPGAQNNLGTAPGLWYEFQGNNSIVTLNTCSPVLDFDIHLGVFSGSCDALVCEGVSSNIGLAGCPFLSGRADEMSFVAFAGVSYYIYVTGLVGAAGNFEMFIDCELLNDECENALPIECGETVAGTTVDGNPDVYPACGTSFSTAAGVWYSLIGNGNELTLSTCNDGTDYDTKMFLFEGACGALVCIDGNDDDFSCPFSIRHSTITFNSVDGITYYVLVNGFGSAEGDFELSLTGDCGGGPGGGDDCDEAPDGVVDDVCDADCLEIGVPQGFDNTGATVQAGEVDPGPGTSCTFGDGWCSFEPQPFLDNTVWFRFVAPASGCVDVGANGADFQIAVYSSTDCGDFGTFVEIGGDDDNGPGLEPLLDDLAVTPGETYWVQIDGYNGTQSAGVVFVNDCEAPIAACDEAVEIFCDDSVTGSNVGEPTLDLAFCGTSLNTIGGVWFKFTGLGDNVTVSTCNPGTDYDTKIGVFTGTCNFAGLVCIGGNDDQAGGFDPACDVTGIGFNRGSTVTFAAMNGVEYYIYVTGFAGSTGNFELTVDCDGVAPLAGEDENGLSAINTTQLNPTEASDALAVGDFYPNPTAHNANIQIYAPIEAEAQIQLFDAVGRLAHRSEVDLYSGVNTVELQIADLPVGSYFAKIVIGKETFQKKLVIVE